MTKKIKKPLLIDTELAEILGLQPSIILNQIDYWVKKNEKKKQNFFNGMYWSYNTYEQWREQFRFWKTKKSVSNWVRALVREGFLLKRRGKYRTWITVNYERIQNIESSKQTKIMLASSKKGKPFISEKENLSLLKGKPFTSPATSYITQRLNTDIPLTEDCPSDMPIQTLTNVSKTENLSSKKGKPFTSPESPSVSDSHPGWWYDKVMKHAKEVFGDDYCGEDYMSTPEEDIATERKGIKILFDMGYDWKTVNNGLDELEATKSPKSFVIFMFKETHCINILLGILFDNNFQTMEIDESVSSTPTIKKIIEEENPYEGMAF